MCVCVCVCAVIPDTMVFFAGLTLPTRVTPTATGRAIRIQYFNACHGVTTVQPDLGVPRAITGAGHKLYIQ